MADGMRRQLVLALMASTGCNVVLGIPPTVEILCESGDDCAGGFCGEASVCDDRQWAITWANDGDEELHAVAWVDPDREGPEEGHLLLAGSFTGHLDPGAGHAMTSEGGRDGFVVALDPRGDVLWTTHIRGPGNQRATAMGVDETGTIYVAGELGGDATIGTQVLAARPDVAEGFVLRLDLDGTVRWQESFGGTDELTVEDVAVSNEAPVVVGTYRGGWTNGPPGAEPSARQAGYILGYTEDASTGSVSGFGSSEDLRACCALVDPLTDTIMVGGGYDGDLSVGGVQFPAFEGLEGYILVFTPDSMGGTELSAIGLGQSLDAMSTDSLSRLAIGMQTSAEPGIAVFRLLANEITEQVRGETPSGTARIAALVNNRDNETLAFGRFSATLDLVEGPSLVAEDSDLFVLTIDDQWRLPPGRSWAFGGVGDVTPVGIAADDEGRVMIAGTFEGTLELANDFGGVTLQSGGGPAVFVAQLRL